MVCWSWLLPPARANHVHLSPTLRSMMPLWELGVSPCGGIYTLEIGKHCKSGLSLFPPSRERVVECLQHITSSSQKSDWKSWAPGARMTEGLKAHFGPRDLGLSPTSATSWICDLKHAISLRLGMPACKMGYRPRFPQKTCVRMKRGAVSSVRVSPRRRSVSYTLSASSGGHWAEPWLYEHRCNLPPGASPGSKGLAQQLRSSEGSSGRGGQDNGFIFERW